MRAAALDPSAGSGWEHVDGALLQATRSGRSEESKAAEYGGGYSVEPDEREQRPLDPSADSGWEHVDGGLPQATRSERSEESKAAEYGGGYSVAPDS